MLIAPRGLVTILLFNKIIEHYGVAPFNEGVLALVIIGTNLVMMLGLISSGGTELDEVKMEANNYVVATVKSWSVKAFALYTPQLPGNWHLIQSQEELTLDYAAFLDESMEPFTCNCGAKNCRGKVVGTPNNTLTAREKKIQGL